jgi:putative ABC transport system permease protein
MSSPRLKKIVREIVQDPAKNLMLVLAIALGVFGIGTMLGAYSVLTRTMAENYMGTRPASATIEVDPTRGLDPAVVDEVRHLPGIAQADRRATLTARMQVNGAWMPMLMFVVDDFDDLRTNKVTAISGAWPPPTGTILVERTALQVMQAGEGQKIVVRTPHGVAQEVAISGVVHDPGLAPAWQEKEGYAYLTLATLQQLGERQGFDELRVLVDDPGAEVAKIEARAKAVADYLTKKGFIVHEIQVPRPRAHPHQGQMNAVLTLFIVFSFLTLVLGAILVASSVNALMTKQVREIGVMKTIGASSGQIAGLYLGMVAGLALLAVAASVPLSRVAAAAMIRMIAELLNLEVRSDQVPSWVAMVQVAAGVVIPLLVTALPAWRASRISVRQALANFGVSSRFGRGGFDARLARFRALGDTFTLSLRNAFRQRGRLFMTLALLAAGGGVFMSALNLSRMWEVRLGAVTTYRRDDVEVRLAEAASDPGALVREVARVPGVITAEPWAEAAVAFTRAGEPPIVRTYPDKTHASFTMLAFPTDTKLLVPYPILEGRWLTPGGAAENEVVLNEFARVQAPGVKAGDLVHLTMEGRDSTWRVVGFAQDIARPATAYTHTTAYMRVTGEAENVIRVAYGDRSIATSRRLTPQVEDALEQRGARIIGTRPIFELRSAIADHMRVLVSSLLALAVLMALVGSLGLASTMSVNVLERTRELGVMRAIGATPARIGRLVIGEGLATGALSLLLSFLLSLPLSLAIGGLLGRMAFRAPLALAVSGSALLWWIGLVVVGSIVATLYPALRAARLTIREALAYE